MAIEIVDLPSYKMVDLSTVMWLRLPEGKSNPLTPKTTPFLPKTAMSFCKENGEIGYQSPTGPKPSNIGYP